MQNKELSATYVGLRVGHGNLLMPIAAQKNNLEYGVEADVTITEFGALAASVLHQRLRASDEAGEKYTQNGSGLRNLALIPLSISSQLEAFGKRPSFVLGRKPPAKVLGSANDMTFGTNWRKDMRQVLLVGDTRLKPTAVEILKASPDITAFVHTQEGLEHARKNGVKVEIVRPLLPYPTTVQPAPGTIASERIVVKPSGSGMKPHEQFRLMSALAGQQVPWAFHLPGETLSSNGHTATKKYSGWRPRLEDYLAEFQDPPAVFITPPSEGTLIGAVLQQFGTKVIFMSLTGIHEKENLQWAQRYGLASAVLDYKNPAYWADIIKEVLAMPAKVRSWDQFGLVTTPYTKALFPQLT